MVVSSASDLTSVTISNNADWAETHVVLGLDAGYLVENLSARMQVRAGGAETRVPTLDIETDETLKLRFLQEGPDILLVLNVPADIMRSILAGEYVRDILIFYSTAVVYAGRGNISVVQGITRY